MGNTRSQSDDINRARGQLVDIVKKYKIEAVEDAIEDVNKDLSEMIEDVTMEEENILREEIGDIKDKTDDDIEDEIKKEDNEYKEKEKELGSFKAGIPEKLQAEKTQIDETNKKDKEKSIEQDKLLNKMYQENIHRTDINRQLAKITPGSNGCSSNYADEMELEDKKNIEDSVQEDFNEDNEDEQIGGYISNQMYELNKKYIENAPEDNYRSVIKSSASKK